MLNWLSKYFYLSMVLLIVITGSFFYFLANHYSYGQQEMVNINNNAQSSIPTETEADIELPKNYELGSGVVPHHLLAEDIIDNFWQNVALAGQPETLVLLSPDHYTNDWYAQANGFLGLSSKQQDFFQLVVDQQTLAKLNNIKEASSYLALDHGLTAHLPFIKKYLPQSKILPFLIPRTTDVKQLDDFTAVLAKTLPINSLVVASVDFSHYLPREAADFHDVKSYAGLVDFQPTKLKAAEVDCWQCLYSARLFARLRGKEAVQLLAHDNSANLASQPNNQETTSYFSLLFKAGNMNNLKNTTGQTALFVGDIMLDRGVEYLMNKKSIFYPFEQVNRFFSGVDFVVGNLEGPIIKNPPRLAGDSLQFAFSPETLKALKFSSFNLFSLANNHTLNMGQDGLDQTRKFLDQENIAYMGDPGNCAPKWAYIKDGFVFLGFNKTYSFNCSNSQLVETVTEVKAANPDSFVIISIHWGSEYKPQHSASQQKLGWQLIDAGADLIIGHHPHVVQDIELYKNKLIFYSLGNFIFDQYFSQPTQEGLAIGLEKYPHKQVYRIFPIKSNMSQPHLMTDEESQTFLSDLAERSSQTLQEQIKNGIIETGDNESKEE